MTPYLFERLYIALEGAPDVLDALLGSVRFPDPIWDYRPFSERFTLREIVAHLADLESVWIYRLTQIRDHDQGPVERSSTDQMAIDHDYPNSHPLKNLDKFREGRHHLLSLLKSMNDSDWLKVGVFPSPLGKQSMTNSAMFIAIHDGYHTGQIAQWLALAKRTSKS